MYPGVIKTNNMASVLGESSFKLRIRQTLIGLSLQSADPYAEKEVPGWSIQLRKTGRVRCSTVTPSL